MRRWSGTSKASSKRSELDVDLVLPAKLPRLADEKEIALFRVIQAALTNVVRHSGSRRAHIRIVVHGRQIQAITTDEGKGIDPAVLARLMDSSKSLGVGISGMRERMLQFGGALDISSGKDGTRVVAALPLDVEEAEAVLQEPSGARVTAASSSEPAAGLSRKRVLIVDDHEVVRRGVRSLFDNQPDLEVCGEASNGIDAVNKTQDLHPDLVILDLIMPDAGGLTAAHRIRELGCAPKILVFTSHTYRGLEKLLQSSGCDGYVLKSYAARDLLRGVREVLGGRKFYSERLRRTHSA